MKLVEFETMKKEFTQADTEGKVNMYVQAEDLTQEQYKELLKLFPLHELNKLEATMA